MLGSIKQLGVFLLNLLKNGLLFRLLIQIFNGGLVEREERTVGFIQFLAFKKLGWLALKVIETQQHKHW